MSGCAVVIFTSTAIMFFRNCCRKTSERTNTGQMQTVYEEVDDMKCVNDGL